MAKRTQSTSQNFGDKLFNLGFLILVAVVPLGWDHIPILLGQPSEFVFVAYYPKLLALYIGIAILFLAWFVASPNRVLLRASSLTSIATLYIGLTTTSIFWAINRVEATLLIVHHIGLLLLFFVLLNTVRIQNLTRHVRTIVAVGVIIAILGIIQYAGWGLHWLPSAGFPSGTLGYRNFAAMYTILCIPLGLLLFFETRHEISLWGWALSTATLITFLFCTRTRGAWVGLGVSAVVGLLALFLLKTHDTHRLWRNIQSILTRQHVIPAVVSLLLSVGFLSIVSPNMQGRGFDRNRLDKSHILTSAISILDRSKDQRRSVQDRLSMWRHTHEMIADHPITGVGVGNWQFAYPAYDGGDIVWESATPRRPHNDYLWIAAELGIPGLLIYFAFLITVAIHTVRLIATQNRSRVRLPLAFALSILALSVHAFFSFPRERIAVSMLFWILIAFLAVLESDHRPRTHNALWQPVRIGGIIVILLGIGISIRALNFDTFFSRASKAITRGDWTQVIRETTTALDQGVFDAQAYLVRGAAHAYMGNHRQALADNTKCLQYHPNFLNAHNNMGTYYNTLQQFDKAVPALKQTLTINPKHPDAHANLGIAYQGLQQFDASTQALQRAFELEPDNANIRSYLAKAHYSLGEYRLSRADTSGAITAYTNFLNIWRGDANSASTVRQKLKNLQPSHP